MRKHALAVLVALCAALPAAPQSAKQKADDEAVIEAALLEFYKDSEWNWNWNKGDFVVVNPAWKTAARTQFDILLEKAQERAAKFRETKAEAEELRKIQGEAASRGAAYEVSAPMDLAKLSLDPRIVLFDLPRKRGWLPGTEPVKAKGGKAGTARVSARVSPPGYSADGRFACLQMSAPWSVHSADLTFFLERSESGWKVRQVSATFYV